MTTKDFATYPTAGTLQGDERIPARANPSTISEADVNVTPDLLFAFTLAELLASPLSVSRGGTGSATAGDARTALGLVIGTDVQAFSSVLQNTTASFTTAQATKLNIAPVSDVTAVSGSVQVTNVIALTQGQYDALDPKAAGTVYFINSPAPRIYLGTILISGHTLDVDAQNFILARGTAHGAAVSSIVANATNNLFLRLKSENVWGSIDHMALLAGARSMTEAAVMVKGTAFTNNNFVDNDLDIKTGLKSDGTTKELDTNVNVTSFTNNNSHFALWDSDMVRGSGTKLGVPTNDLFFASNTDSAIKLFSSAFLRVQTQNTHPFIGASRAGFTQLWTRNNGDDGLNTSSAQATSSQNVFVFSKGGTNFGNPRIAFYTLGKGLLSRQGLSNLEYIMYQYLTELEELP